MGLDEQCRIMNHVADRRVADACYRNVSPARWLYLKEMTRLVEARYELIRLLGRQAVIEWLGALKDDAGV